MTASGAPRSVWQLATLPLDDPEGVVEALPSLVGISPTAWRPQAESATQLATPHVRIR